MCLLLCPPAWFGNPGNENNPKWTNANWLKSRFHFSFAEYNDPKNSNFGVLRVMNDDLVQPSRGFGTHGHREMEICTYVVHGELTHKDSMGTQESLGKGSIQFMTAGELPFKRLWLCGRACPSPSSYSRTRHAASSDTEH